MIGALCANPCVDRAVTIEKFTYGGMNRIQESREDGSGKGVNVALACAQLGMEAACIGFIATSRGELIINRLNNSGCQNEFVPTSGAVRVNTKVLDRSTGIITEINESGNAVTPAEIDCLMELVVRWATRCEYMVLTGSPPPGCPDDIYKNIILECRKAAPGCRMALDAEGVRFARGLEAKPFMVKPNRYELELLCGRELPAIQDIHEEAMKLIASGVELVLVSLGGDGAYVTDGNQAWCAPAPAVEVRSTVGAGDCMVAGMLLGLTQGWPMEEAFRFGMAAATSSVTTVGTQLIDVQAFKGFISQIEVRRVY